MTQSRNSISGKTWLVIRLIEFSNPNTLFLHLYINLHIDARSITLMEKNKRNCAIFGVFVAPLDPRTWALAQPNTT
jgi:hypothetical protein